MLKGQGVRSPGRRALGGQRCWFGVPVSRNLQMLTSSHFSRRHDQDHDNLLLLDALEATRLGATWGISKVSRTLACKVHIAHNSWAQRWEWSHAGMLAVTVMGQVCRGQCIGGRVGCAAHSLPRSHDEDLLAPRSRSSSAWAQTAGQLFCLDEENCKERAHGN